MEQKAKKIPSFGAALALFVIIVAILMLSVTTFNITIQIALMFCIIIASIFAFTWGYKWNDIEKMMKDGVLSMLIATFILMLIGIVIATWIASGTIPYIIYLGLKIISPKFFLLCACLAASFMSVACGSSWSSAGTVGIAFMGIGAGLGINPAMTAGAIISGAYFGDKLSPFSDSTNLAAAMAGTSLFDHISSMIWTTTPTYIIAVVLYTVLGFTSASGANQMDTSTADMYLTALEENFNLGPWLLIPIVVLIYIVVKKAPAIPGLVVSALLGAVMAIIFQGADIIGTLNLMYDGFSIDTGIEQINKLLNRGGLSSMLWTVALYFFACILGQILDTTGVLRVLLSKVIAITTKRAPLIISTLVGSFAMSALTGSLESSMLINSKLFGPAYDDIGLDRKVLSRSLEDTGTMCCALIPWNSNGMFMATTLGVATTAYIPFCFLGLINPIVSIVFAITGIACFKAVKKDDKAEA